MMKDDFKLPPATQRYTGVNLSQGRVQLDSDWNEEASSGLKDLPDKLAGQTGVNREAVRDILAPLTRLGDGLAGAARELVEELTADRWLEDNRNFSVDRASGAVRFGDGRHGARPATGEGNVSAAYRHGAGAASAEAQPPFPRAVAEQGPAGAGLTSGLDKLRAWLDLAGATTGESESPPAAKTADEPDTPAKRLDGLHRELARYAEMATEVGARRLPYFEGKLLDANDFRAEQDYASGRSDESKSGQEEKADSGRNDGTVDPAKLRYRRDSSDEE
jgi:hypothetical protein